MAFSASTTDLRRQNRHLVLRAIAEHGAVSRTDIASSVRLTNAAVSRITRELVEARLVTEYPVSGKRRRVGRPQVRLGLADDGAFVLGVAITLNQKEVVLATCRGEVVARRDCTGLPLDNPGTALDALARAATELIAASGKDPKRLLGGAALVAGRVDPATGKLGASGPLGWRAVNAADTLSRLTGVPFVAEGRAAALLQAEARQGCAAGLRDVLLVNVGLRLGSALMLDGAPVRGAANEAGQLASFPSNGKTLDDTASGLAFLNRLDALGSAAGAPDDGRRLRDIVEAGGGDERRREAHPHRLRNRSRQVLAPARDRAEAPGRPAGRPGRAAPGLCRRRPARRGRRRPAGQRLRHPCQRAHHVGVGRLAGAGPASFSRALRSRPTFAGQRRCFPRGGLSDERLRQGPAMKLNRNIIAGLCFLGFGLLGVFVLIPFGIQIPPDIKYRALSPSFWPYIVCAGIAVVGALLLIAEFLTGRSKTEGGPAADVPQGGRSRWTTWRPAIAMALLLAIYLVLEFLGFVLTTTIGLVALMLLAGERRPLIVLPVALLLPLALHLFFVKAAQRPIPGGILDFLLQRI